MLGIILSVVLVLCSGRLLRADAATDAYGKITDGLIGIRKQFPAIQPKVYALLDQVEKLYKLVKSSSSECSELRKKLTEGQQEKKNQLEATKKTYEMAKADLLKRFEEQQQRLLALEKQRDQLMAKASAKTDLQPAGEVKKA